jgi:titin
VKNSFTNKQTETEAAPEMPEGIRESSGTLGEGKQLISMILSEPPVEFTKPLEDQTVEEEATAVLECEVSRENAKVKWFKNGTEILKSKKYEIVADGRVRKLIIHGCTPEDIKTYTCDAKDFKTSCNLNVVRKYSSTGLGICKSL